jgi:F420-dependent oxidoreductase-like protein
MHLGLQIPSFTYPGVPDSELFERVAEMAVAADETGFDSLWVMDHFYQLPMLGGPANPMLEGYTLLGALAARTARVRLGTLVTGVTYRNPALLAKEVTTLDVISRGRAILGIGAAWHDVEHQAYGFPFPPIRERMDRLEEALEICRRLFTEERPSFTGQYYRIEAAYNLPRPIQKGGPPVLIGGGGERRTLRLVARFADMCNLFGGPATLRHKLDVLAKHCRDVGRDPATILKTRLGTLHVTSSASEAEDIAARLAKGMGEAQVREIMTIGTPDQVGDQLQALVDAGVEGFIFNMPHVHGADGVRRAGEALRKRLS